MTSPPFTMTLLVFSVSFYQHFHHLQGGHQHAKINPSITRVSTSSSVRPRASIHSVESSIISRQTPQRASTSPPHSAGSQKPFKN